jgi:hypothetical protein
MPRDKRDVESALGSKGFRKSEGDHHWFIYYTKDGRKTIAKTKTSHGSTRQIGDGLLSQMAKQCKLTKSQFLALVDCTLLQEGYGRSLHRTATSERRRLRLLLGLGDQVTWVVLGGEVVVDYSRRLKKELTGKRSVWVTGYANDVMAYIPSARVLAEGGYEADSSQIYYGMPSKWSPAIEERIVAKVHELVKLVGSGR